MTGAGARAGRGRGSTTALAVAVAVAVFLFRFLTLGAIENDHFVMLARAHQIFYGDWPVRDFADPGMPLGYGLSAAAAQVGGATLLTEVVLQIALFALTAAIACVLAWRASGSLAIAGALTTLLVILAPRLYNSSKVLAMVAAIWFAWRYVDRPSTRRLVALTAWAAAAFLVRHDYGVYIAVATVAMLLTVHGLSQAPRALVMSAACGLLFVLPWLLYVQWAEGIVAYAGAALRFSAAEAARTNTPHPPAFYVITAAGIALLLLARRARGDVQPAHIVFAAALVVLTDVTFLRDVLSARLPDVLPATAVLAAWPLGRLVPSRAVRWLGITALTLAVGGVCLLLARRGYGFPTPVDVVRQWQRVTMRVHDEPVNYATTPTGAAIVAFLDRCTPPDARVLVAGFGPELPVLAHRPFAGGVPTWIPGYYQAAEDVARARAQLARETVGAVVMLEGAPAFTTAWPALAADLDARGFRGYRARFAGAALDMWLPAGTDVDRDTGLPCATTR